MQRIKVLYGAPSRGREAAIMVEVSAEIVGGFFALHHPIHADYNGKYIFLENDGWNVTHIPSGTSIAANVSSRDLAAAIIGKLSMVSMKWHQVDPFDKMSAATVEKIKEIVRSLGKSKTTDEAWEHGRRLQGILDKLKIH